MLGTEGHIPLCTSLTKTNEHKAWMRAKVKVFLTALREKEKERERERERKRRKYKKRVCVPSVHFLGCIQRLSTQLPACVPALERSEYSPTCVSNER